MISIVGPSAWEIVYITSQCDCSPDCSISIEARGLAEHPGRVVQIELNAFSFSLIIGKG